MKNGQHLIKHHRPAHFFFTCDAELHLTLGAKTAQQIVLDLKGKLVREESDSPASEPAIADAMEALKALGYKQSELSGLGKVMREHPNQSSDEYVRLGLQYLLQRKRG